MKIIKSILIMSVCTSVVFATAQEKDSSEAQKNYEFALKPVLIDSKNGSGTVLGLDYHLTGKLYESESKPAGVYTDSRIADLSINYKVKGTLTASASRNPNNFLESELDGKYLYSNSAITALGAGYFKFETNQSFTNKQSVFGLRNTLTKIQLLSRNDSITFEANIGRVTPTNNNDRKAILGNLNPFNRFDVEVLYNYPLSMNHLKNIEFNYRYFKEINAPSAIKVAGMGSQQFATVLLGFKNDMYIAYSQGKLPFEQKSDRSLKVGVAYKLF